MFIQITYRNGQLTTTGSPQADFGSFQRKVGPWAAWKWDGARLHVEVDRYGCYPLFWVEQENGVIVGDSIAELLKLGVSRELDDRGIAAFLRLGFFLGEDTPFLAIRAFPQGGQLNWQPGEKPLLTRQPIPRSVDESIGRSEIVDGYVMRFREAIKKSLPSPATRTALPLSGGRDSRHIALELHRLGFQPDLVISQQHFASRNDDDAQVAAQVCAALGWPIEVIPQVSDPIASEIEKNRLFDCLTDEHAWFVPSARVINDRGITAIFDGIAGDVLSKGLFIRASWIELGESRNLAKWLEGMPSWGYGWNESAIAQLLDHNVARRWDWSKGLERVREEFARHEHDENPLNSMMFWNRTRREISPFLTRYCPQAEVITPYLDEQVFDFMWSIPTHHLLDHKLHDEAIAVAAPQFADIPFETSAPGNPQLHTIKLMRGMASRSMYWFNKNTAEPILKRNWIRPRLAARLLSRNFAQKAGWYAQPLVWLASLEQLSTRG